MRTVTLSYSLKFVLFQFRIRKCMVDLKSRTCLIYLTNLMEFDLNFLRSHMVLVWETLSHTAEHVCQVILKSFSERVSYCPDKPYSDM